MLTWGFLLLVGGLLTDIVLLCSNLDMFTNMAKMGFGPYVQAFFANSSVSKGVALVAAALALLGLVLYIIGRIRNKDAEKNPIIPVKVKKYVRDTRGEFKKITWPTFSTVVRNTGVVLAMCAVTAVVIIAVDMLSGTLVDLLLKL